MDIVADRDVTYHFRDINKDLVSAVEVAFEEYGDKFKPSVGDVFLDAPAADAIVCTANSFGIMGSGGIDKAFIAHFGQSIQDEVFEIIRDEHDGELLVGQAAIVSGIKCIKPDIHKYNQGDPIHHVIMVPTMRVPQGVSQTPNAYLALRAVILAIRNHNRKNTGHQIKEVILPGLASRGGQMPNTRCAYQMLQAYETHVLGKSHFRLSPKNLTEIVTDHNNLCQKT
ncbi:uncharacterized protein LOC131953148 [Physella acuta]|uniref:uncharacterized protein LOC131953148 n=1 Tax=Physella acuta TaxID=109671 RepID=UPI0027DE8397|nr:uncharacterized protein LOC131953148 [Physella acuta]XP_059172181.1 uncharacterized protein LOC131953148 [Physella acuta]XP_059172182.1 uncharacterized protein LOC131953148 [Physella acuta]